MITENLNQVRKNIQEACEVSGRDPKEVTLIAVSKTKPVSMLAKMNMIGYKIKSICASGIPNNIRSTAATRNIPTPVATAIISV